MIFCAFESAQEFCAQFLRRTLNILFLLLITMPVNAGEIRQSTNFKMLCDQFSGAAVSTASDNYRMEASLGSSQIAGVQVSDNFVLISGCRNYKVDVGVTMKDGQNSYSSDQKITYEIVVRNNGMSHMQGLLFDDDFPAGLASIDWTCSAGAGASCSQLSGTGDISLSFNMTPGSNVIINALIDTGSHTGQLINTAIVSMPGGQPDFNPANDSVTDINLFKSDEVFSDGFE